MDKSEKEESHSPSSGEKTSSEIGETTDIVNSSGHIQELDRSFGFWRLVSSILVLLKHHHAKAHRDVDLRHVPDCMLNMGQHLRDRYRF